MHFDAQLPIVDPTIFTVSVSLTAWINIYFLPMVDSKLLSAIMPYIKNIIPLADGKIISCLRPYIEKVLDLIKPISGNLGKMYMTLKDNYFLDDSPKYKLISKADALNISNIIDAQGVPPSHIFHSNNYRETTYYYKSTKGDYYLPYFENQYHDEPLKLYARTSTDSYTYTKDPVVVNPRPTPEAFSRLFINDRFNRYTRYEPHIYTHRDKILYTRNAQGVYVEAYANAARTPNHCTVKIVQHENKR